MLFTREVLVEALMLVGSLAHPHSTGEPQGIRSLRSKLYPGASISYKEAQICETTPGVKSYSGYVHLPSAILQDVEGPEAYNITGGPGASSTYSVGEENGPCCVNSDSNSTSINPWSFNNYVNMLYIDQPNMVRFSYDTLVSGTLDLTMDTIIPMDTSAAVIQQNETTLTGTFPSQNPGHTANTTALGARVLWHFTQVWMQEFPEYRTNNDKISLWTYSYGGFYGPGYLAHFEQQNQEIVDGSIDDRQAARIHLDTLGITNGCIDLLDQGLSYPEMAYNNTYGFQTIPEDVYHDAVNNFTKPGGCSDQILQCRQLGLVGDPDKIGANETVNAACTAAFEYCFAYVEGAYQSYSNVGDSSLCISPGTDNYQRSVFDMGNVKPNPLPPLYPVGFFNQKWVQDALGVPLNFTLDSLVVQNAFFSTGDAARRTIGDLEYLLDSGMKVALVYGDREYRCNWLGAEKISLSAQYNGALSFRPSGYENITTNSFYVGGVVRQYGDFSFSRVFNAGHSVSSYQPETLYQVFMRAMFDRDVPTGSIYTATNTDYHSDGPLSSFEIKNVMPASPPVTCNIWAIPITCTDNQIRALTEGVAVVKDYIVVSPAI